MVKKVQKIGNDKKKSDAQLSSTVKDSAQQIWLAGLGAFSKAQEEGGKVFEALVKEGLTIQRKTQAVAEEKITEATSRVTSMANDIGSRAVGQWDKLENIFEERVAKALGKLGVPSNHDIQALHARIDALTQGVGKSAPTKTTAKPAAKAARARPPRNLQPSPLENPPPPRRPWQSPALPPPPRQALRRTYRLPPEPSRRPARAAAPGIGIAATDTPLRAVAFSPPPT
ncbi:phasin family protein [Acidovorax carolinensis]|uniref:phasin family protein n=1 Tax=Acidovorax carolinensis TaxID=553814 RepID=UPI003AAD2E5D